MDSALQQIKDELDGKGWVHIHGHLYYMLLMHLGATYNDLQKIESGSIHKQLPKDREDTMAFRQISFHRVLLEEQDQMDDEVIEFVGLPEQVSTLTQSITHNVSITSHDLTYISEDDESSLSELSDDERVPAPGLRRSLCRSNSSVSLAGCESVTNITGKEICSDDGAKVYFERSGLRKWNPPPTDFIDSSVPQAIAKLNDILQPMVHDDQDGCVNTDSKFTINDQLLIRVNKTADDVAEPTPEGIHQDATEISSVTLIGRSNVVSGKGGESRIWKMEQPTGNYDSDEFGKFVENSDLAVPGSFSWGNVLFNKALESPWETVIFNDRKVKHEVRNFFMGDKEDPCYRDVIVSFVRKPLASGDDKRMVNGKEETIM